MMFYNEQYMEVYLVSQISGNGTTLDRQDRLKCTQGVDRDDA